MLIADIDNLKLINDSMGHPQGDRAICLIADTLKAKFRKTDIVGRIGGDEFVVFLEGVESRKTLESMVSSLQQSLSGLTIGGANDLTVNVSIGIAESRTGEVSFAELYTRADKALYNAKRNGKDQYAMYSANE